MKKFLITLVMLLTVAFCIPAFAEDVIDDVTKEDSKNECCDHEFEWIKIEYVPATCTEDSYWITESRCVYCGITKEEYEGEGIEYKDWAPGARKRLGHLYTVTCNTHETCTEQGEYTRTCSRCGYVDTVIKPATGHLNLTGWIEKTITEPTCTEDGLECCYSICLDCGEKVNYSELPIYRSGHNFDRVWEEITPCTCEQDGITKISDVCLTCGYEREESIEYKTEEKYNHCVTGTLRRVEATCTTAGYTGDTQCWICDKIIAYGEYVPALGHDYTEVRVEPTCTEDGYITYTCTRCGDTYTTTLPATGHEWSSIVFTEHPTEWKTILSRTCHKCGKTETSYWDW